MVHTSPRAAGGSARASPARPGPPWVPFSLRAVAACSLGLALAGPARAQDAAEHIRQAVETIRAGEEVRADGQVIASRWLLPDFYEARAFEPAWTRGEAQDALFAAVAASVEDGLDPGDYHDRALRSLRAALPEQGGDPEQRARYDLLLTDSLIRLAYHLSFGKVDPERLDRHWNIARTFEAGEPLSRLQRALAGDDLATEIAALRPAHDAYGRLRGALARYRGIAAAGGWPAVPAGPTLEKGKSGKRVSALRARLAAEGFVEPVEGGASQEQAGTADVFDERLEAAVVRFQARYLLATDGKAGPRTLAAMNLPVERRIDQIRVNLERARWVLHDLDDEFILVDIAGFRLHEYRDGNNTWSTRVQVGKPYRKTPIFKSKIEYMVVNPTWTVPPTILRKDVLPAVLNDPGYLDKRKIRVYTRGGQRIDPATIDFGQYASGGFPYRLRQEAGQGNALGRVKFIFPNDYAVYLHDTPSKRLFDRPERAFSSGCIRVQEPMELAERLLRNTDKWTMERFVAAMDSGKTRTVMLDEPVTVMLMYWTVSVPEEGVVEFKRDVYDRDRAVLQGLNGKFRFRRRPVTTPSQR